MAPAAWFLTANDDAGGGTYQVIEALRDRIDVVVQALSFNTRFLGDLLDRVERGVRPEEVVPPAIVFDADELDRMHREILAVPLPVPVRRRLEFFAASSSSSSSRRGSSSTRPRTPRGWPGVDRHLLAALDTGRDRCRPRRQTRNGLSVRALQTLIVYAKAMAYFRGNARSTSRTCARCCRSCCTTSSSPTSKRPSSTTPSNQALRIDRVAWIRRPVRPACRQYDRRLDRDDPVGAILAEFGRGLDGLAEAEVRRRLAQIEGVLSRVGGRRQALRHLFDDVLALKYLHQRYTNYLAWLRWSGA